MSIATADLNKAIVTAWAASGLDALFQGLGGEAPILQDQEATPSQAMPYCVTEAFSPSTTERMSAGTSRMYETRDVPVTFHVFAGEVPNDSRTSKEIAAYLAEEIMKVYGGHPTESASADLALDNGSCLITENQNDYGIRAGDDHYEWVVEYLFRCDIPVAI